MIRVLIPKDREFYFYKKELKKMYEKNRAKIQDESSFEFIINNTFFYAFLVDKTLLGAIYYFTIDKKLFVNAFAKRGHFKEKLECLKLSQKWFKTDIYATAQNKASALCLLRCGFCRAKENLFVYKKETE